MEVANGLLEGYTRRLPRHFTVSQELPLRLTERPFPEKVDTDTPHGGRPGVRCAELGERKGHKPNTGAKFARFPFILKIVLKPIIQN